MYDILVAGELNPDLILSEPNLEPRFGQTEVLVKEAELTIGSSSAIFACGAARLGLKVAFIGVVGQDLFGDFILEAIQRRGVDTSFVMQEADRSTGFSVNLNRGVDRAILTYLGAIDALRAEQVSDQILGQARHLHIASYFLQTQLQPGLFHLFQRARALGLSTSLDTNWDPSGRWAEVAHLLGVTDVFFPNAAEALALSGVNDVEAAVERLSQAGTTVVLKLGAAGAIARRGQETAQHPAIPVVVRDTVGAGDSFDAGFIYGYLQAWELVRCLKLAIACGSLSTREFGGTAAQPTLEEALAALEAA